jgi:hypothetical protein
MKVIIDAAIDAWRVQLQAYVSSRVMGRSRHAWHLEHWGAITWSEEQPEVLGLRQEYIRAPADAKYLWEMGSSEDNWAASFFCTTVPTSQLRWVLAQVAHQQAWAASVDYKEVQF